MTAELEDEYKYGRSGYYSKGNHSDLLLSYLTSKVKTTGTLPKRWFYVEPSSFIKRYGHLGNVLWAASSSSHTLLLNGNKLFRLWTDAKNHCFLDLNPLLADKCAFTLDVGDIPAGNIKKCKPFKKRTLITTLKQLQELLIAIKGIYGVDFT